MTENEIVVGIDESPSARAALRWAAEQAERTESPLRAVHVLDRPLGTDPDGRAFALEDLMYSPDDAVPPMVRRGVTAVFNEVTPKASWTLDFCPGRPVTSWSPNQGRQRCWWSAHGNT